MDAVVDEIEFKTKEPKNPINLWSCKRSVRSYCDHPQPRYMISPLKNFALPQNKYILYTKCLPGCSRTTNTTKIPDDKFTDKSGSFHPISTVFNDSHCTSSYTAKRRGKREALTDITTPSHNWKEKVSDNTSMCMIVLMVLCTQAVTNYVCGGSLSYYRVIGLTNAIAFAMKERTP